MKSSVLPPNILKCLRPEDRKSLGKGGLLPEEALRKCEIKSERDLQKQIVGLLRLKGIEPIVSRFGKKTTNNIGTPDIIFSVSTFNYAYGPPLPVTVSCGWEIKLPTCKSSKEQEQMAVRLSTPPNAWRYRIIRSIDEALTELKQMGIIPETTLSPTAENAVASATS